MKSITSIRSALVAAALCLASPALAQSESAPAPLTPGAAAPRATQAPAPALNFSAEQRKQIDALRTKTQAQLAPLRTELVAKRRELRALWATAAPQRAAILVKLSEVDKLRQRMQQVRVDQELAFRAILTPEQRAARRAAAPAAGPHGRGPGADGMGKGPMRHGHGPDGRGMANIGTTDPAAPDCWGGDGCDDCGECEGGSRAAPCMPPPAPAAKAADEKPPR